MQRQTARASGVQAAMLLLTLSLPALGIEFRPTNRSHKSGIRSARTLLQWPSDSPLSDDSTGDDNGRQAPLVTDRPDFTEASSTVGLSVTQVEMGYTWFRNDSGQGSQLRAHTFPELLIRQGLFADWFELRVGWSFNSQSETISGVTGASHGADDLYLGSKLAITEQSGSLPEMALLPQMTVPVGGRFSAGRVLPGLNWLYSWEVSSHLALAGSSQYNLSLDEITQKLHGEVSQSLTANIAVADRQSAYVEWFAFFPSGAETEHTEHYTNGGFTFSWSDDFQTDIRCGCGLNEHSTDFFVGTGMAIRF